MKVQFTGEIPYTVEWKMLRVPMKQLSTSLTTMALLA